MGGRNISWRLCLGIWVILGILWGTPGVQGKDPSDGFTTLGDALEPNDRPHWASEIKLDQWYQVTFYPRLDRDYLQIFIPKPGILSVETSGLPRGLQVAVRLCNRQGQPLGRRTQALAVKPGSHRLCLEEIYGRSSKQPFRLRVRLLPDPNQWGEESPKPLTMRPGESYEMAFFPPGVVRTYRIQSSEPGYLTLVFGGLPSKLHPKIVLRKKGRQLIQQGLYWKNSMTLRLSRSESYDLSISEAAWQFSRRTFTLYTHFRKDFDPHEENNTPQQARELPLGQPTRVWLYPQGDVDWFWFRDPQAGRVYLITSNWRPFWQGSKVDLLIDLYPWKGGSPIGRLGPSGQPLRRVIHLKEGRYRLRVWSAFRSSLQPFTLFVDTLPDRANFFRDFPPLGHSLCGPQTPFGGQP